MLLFNYSLFSTIYDLHFNGSAGTPRPTQDKISSAQSEVGRTLRVSRLFCQLSLPYTQDGSARGLALPQTSPGLKQKNLCSFVRRKGKGFLKSDDHLSFSRRSLADRRLMFSDSRYQTFVQPSPCNCRNGTLGHCNRIQRRDRV